MALGSLDSITRVPRSRSRGAEPGVSFRNKTTYRAALAKYWVKPREAIYGGGPRHSPSLAVYFSGSTLPH